jgi:hypothetical protein
MAKFTVRKGRRYRATIKLTGLKRLASNETIAGVFEKVGFAEVRVEGSGGTRYATGLWPRPMRPRIFRPRSRRSRRCH